MSYSYFYSYFAVLFLLIGVGIGSSSKFIIKPLNPKYCISVHTGVTCRYEFFKYFNGGHTKLYIGNSSKFIVKRPLNPKNCTSLHTGVTCRYEFFKYFNSGYSQLYIAKKSSKIHGTIKNKCSNKSEFPEPPECEGEKLLDLSEYQKLANIQYQRDVKGVWISGKKSYFLTFPADF